MGLMVYHARARATADHTDAIMFGDRLTLDQCSRLVTQLGHTRYPFICAHGRPTAVPLLVLDDLDGGVAPSHDVDWGKWKVDNNDGV